MAKSNLRTVIGYAQEQLAEWKDGNWIVTPNPNAIRGDLVDHTPGWHLAFDRIYVPGKNRWRGYKPGDLPKRWH